MRAGPALCLVAALLLDGCGGGISIGFGDFWGDDVPPSVSLASSATGSVHPGDTVRYVAAAADSDSGIDRVRFYRMDGVDITQIGSDASEPYELSTTVPNDGRITLTVFARAWDRAGNAADSVAVILGVTP